MENKITDNNEFQKELASYSYDDLGIIIETQKDLYSVEEMQMLKQELEKRKQEKQAQIIANLPKEIVCPKCDGVNPFENDFCQFCGCKMEKEKYYREDWAESEEESYESDETKEKTSYTFHYVISFLIPLVGFIVGAIFLGKDTEAGKSVGKGCIILGIVSIVIAYLLWAALIAGSLF